MLADLVMAPVDMMRDSDWGTKFCGVLMAGLYIMVGGLVGILGLGIKDKIENPTYTYADAEGRVEVTPSKGVLFQRVSNDFGRHASYIDQQICDTNIQHYTTQGVILVGKVMVPQTYHHQRYTNYNCQSFNKVSDTAVIARLARFGEYMQQARAEFNR